MSSKVKSQEVRINSGSLRGRKLSFPDAQGLRPTLGRTRETLFNWLRPSLPGAACLDLFAGSGVLGFEALSIGASKVTLIEKDRNIYQALVTNAQRMKINVTSGPLSIQCCDALAYLDSAKVEKADGFDVIFIDPPYSQASLLTDTLNRIANNQLSCGWVYLESNNKDQLEEAISGTGFGIEKAAYAGVSHSVLARLR